MKERERGVSESNGGKICVCVRERERETERGGGGGGGGRRRENGFTQKMNLLCYGINF